MMTGILTPHKSPKRKRDDIDYRLRTASTSPASSVTSISAKDDHLDDECNPAIGGNSPQISVAGELGELDLHGTSTYRFESASHGASDDKQMTDKMDEEPSVQGTINIDAAPTVTPTDTKEKEKIPLASPDGGDLQATSAAPARQQSKHSSQQKHRSRQKSPPLSGDVNENPFTWRDSEITGYAPTDPNDDGYGINGIGFKPTAAIAWDRSQRRKKQVAEWKSREAREAREMRKSRRDGILADEHVENKIQVYKKVKFDIATED
ncbi:hypothetical protein BDDG_07274 [Blastomyces dermatitidis ATCC 18188]|uniref:Uncharacterized protein n=1 Tax=Ajellomyces dermatitidis (strain ATCC 18188 / CBS 674.68) TaxID=653446 RepID=F2TM66_AJEDA|nr:hypothetical protein BDDG_07274 [Blastomyces dermatitidis ATCC 18188]